MIVISIACNGYCKDFKLFPFLASIFFKGSGVTKFTCDSCCPWQSISEGALITIQLFRLFTCFSNQLTDRGVLPASVRLDDVGIT